MKTKKYIPNGCRGEPKMMMQILSKPMLPLQGANCIVAFLSQGDAIGPGYIGLSARGIALNIQYRMLKAHALKGQHNLAQRHRPGEMGIRIE